MAEQFGPYQLHEKIAQGGMAEVFVATGGGNRERPLAIKRMFSHLSEDEDVINMFIDEARIASRLEHPHIVDVYDLGVVDNTFYIAMEHVPGLDLRRACELGVKYNRFFSRPMAVYIIAAVAGGLDYAHSKTDDSGRPMNIVHRDVSPQNVLLGDDGSIKLCDFGIAKAESRLAQTRVGEVKGKLAYMSPEQCGIGDVDRRSDIFTLGIVLYELTTKTRLFRCDDRHELLNKLTRGDFPRPSQACAGYPARLEQIVMKALSIEPQQRYQSARDMRRDLLDWLSGQSAQPESSQLAELINELMELGGVTPATVPGHALQQPQQESVTVSTSQMDMSDSQRQDVDSTEEKTKVDKPPQSTEPTVETRLPSQQVQDNQRDDSEFEEVTRVDGVSEGTKPTADHRVPAALRDTDSDDPPEPFESGAATVVEEPLDETTTNPLAGNLDSAEADESLDQAPPLDQDTPFRQTDEFNEPFARPDTSSPPQHHNKREGSRQPSRPAAPPEVQQPEPTPQPTPTGPPADPSGATPFNEEALLDDVPDLNRGGRELTGLNEVRDGGGLPSQADRSTPQADSPAPWEQIDLDWLRELPRSVVIGVTAAATALVLGGLVMWVSQNEEEPEQQQDDRTPVVEAQEVSHERVALQLETEPAGAAVVVNGVATGERTPTEVSLIDGEQNDVWLARTGYHPVRLGVSADGESMDYQVELQRAVVDETAALSIGSEPAGADVFIDGEEAGTTPVRVENLPVGVETHVQLEKEGYARHVAFVAIDEDTELATSLVSEDAGRVPARYSFEPEGATVLVSGTQVGTTPLEVEHRRGDWVELLIRADDRETEQRSLRLDDIGSFQLIGELSEEEESVGRVSIDADEPATAFVEDRAVGTIPTDELELPVGEPTLMVETMDGELLEAAIDVDADDLLEYKMQLGDGLELVDVD